MDPDCLNVSDLLNDKGGSLGILAGTFFSNHVPILLFIHDNQGLLSPTLPIPNALQMDNDLEGSIYGLWQDL